MSVSKGVSFRGILRYLVYVFVGGWMFFLGILVGRGNVPVTFDTKSFQTRLEAIVQSYGKTDAPEEKMDLEFYDALNNPVRHEVTGEKNIPNEIIPKKEAGHIVIQVPIVEAVPVKTSRKAATLNKAALDKSPFKDKGSGQTPVKEKVPLAKTQVQKEKQALATDADAAYTLQVAAYKSPADAVTQMAILEKKGFASYRTLGKIEGVTWYRVRVGSFATRKAASLYAEKLKHAKIEAMIIKKE